MSTSTSGVCAISFAPYLDDCVLPIPGTTAAAYFATGGVIDLSVTNEVEAGTTQTQKDGCGRTCAAIRECDTHTGLINGTFTLCSLCPTWIAAITGAQAILDGANVIGYSASNASTKLAKGILTVWTKSVQNGSSAQVCAPGGSEYFAIVMPNVCASLADAFTLSDGFNNVTGTLSGTSGAPVTAAALNTIYPGILPAAAVLDPSSALHVFTTTVLPTINADSCTPVGY